MNSGSCISSVSYIKPQQQAIASHSKPVVYRPFPTSNHNCRIVLIFIVVLYIVRFLHQTTTYNCEYHRRHSCISSVSYIKPQRCRRFLRIIHVVYRPFPTSNHNRVDLTISNLLLYIVRFLHQTTTTLLDGREAQRLYIVRFLHQTTTFKPYGT